MKSKASAENERENWDEVIVASEENEEAVMQSHDGDAAQIEIAEQKVAEAQEEAAE